MAKKVKKVTNILTIDDNQYVCTVCRSKIPLLPPCPKCGTPLKIPVKQGTINEIMEYLEKNKGSTCVVMLGKRNGAPILIYELKPKGDSS